MALSMSGKILTILFLTVALTVGPCNADMSMTQHSKQDGMVSGASTKRVRIRGLKMRIDTEKDGENHVIIYDLESGKKYRLIPKRKEIAVTDLKSASEHMKGTLVPERLRRVIKPTGNKTEIGGANCDEYTFDLQVPTVPRHGTSVIQHDSGTVCVSQVIPEGIELTNFVHEAKKRSYTIAAAPLSPTQSPIGSYFYGQEPNVMVLAPDAESALEGIDMEFHAMSTIKSAVTVSDIKFEPIPDEDFQIPADWKRIKDSDSR